MEKGTESDSALSGQTEKHIVSLDALCNLAPFTPQSEKSMANGRPKHQTPCVCVRERQKKTTKKKERTERKSTLFLRQDDKYSLKVARGQHNVKSIQFIVIIRFFLFWQYFGKVYF